MGLIVQMYALCFHSPWLNQKSKSPPVAGQSLILAPWWNVVQTSCLSIINRSVKQYHKISFENLQSPSKQVSLSSGTLWQGIQKPFRKGHLQIEHLEVNFFHVLPTLWMSSSKKGDRGLALMQTFLPLCVKILSVLLSESVVWARCFITYPSLAK